MTIEKLLEKARDFEKKNESFTRNPHDFHEDMNESSNLDDLVSEGDNMYDALEESVKLISDLADELEYKIAVEDWVWKKIPKSYTSLSTQFWKIWRV